MIDTLHIFQAERRTTNSLIRAPDPLA